MLALFRRLATAAVCSIAWAAGCTAAAEVSAAQTADERVLKEKLAQLFTHKTGMKADSISKAPVPGYYEAVVGTSIFYIEPTGKWLFDGNLVDLETRRSLTAQRKVALEAAANPKLDWRSLHLADAIKAQRGQPTKGRVLVLFGDPSCGYCKKLAPVLDAIPNLVTYNFPIAILGPNSAAKNEAIWCAKDRAAAWAAVMKGGIAPPVQRCETSALARNGELAKQLNVTGTPTMFLADGSRLPGYMDAAALERELARVEHKLAADAR